MPGPVLAEQESNGFVMELAASSETDLLLGTIDVDKRDVYNAALLVSDGGERTQVYRKVHLVPFGEYVPGRHKVPLLARIVGDQVPADFKEGTEYTVFTLTNTEVHVAPLICFEDTIGELTRRFVLPNETTLGANLLVDVTNDGCRRLNSFNLEKPLDVFRAQVCGRGRNLNRPLARENYLAANVCGSPLQIIRHPAR